MSGTTHHLTDSELQEFKNSCRKWVCPFDCNHTIYNEDEDCWGCSVIRTFVLIGMQNDMGNDVTFLAEETLQDSFETREDHMRNMPHHGHIFLETPYVLL